MDENRKLPIVGVMGSGREAHSDLAQACGQLLARKPVHLLTGGGGGVMYAVSRAFSQVQSRRGLVVGVLSSSGADDHHPRAGYPNPYVELAIRTHLPSIGAQGTDASSRNHINILSSDAVILLPGGAGTRAEAMLAIRYGKPCMAFGDAAQFVGFPTELSVTTDIDALNALLDAVLSGLGVRF